MTAFKIDSILDKIVNVMPDTTINMALTQYFSDEQKENITLLEFVQKYLFFVIGVAALIIAMLMLSIIQRRLLAAEKNARKQRQIADDLSRRVFVDALTSERNKGGYSEYIQMLQERLKGNEYLKKAVRLICRTFQHSPVFRIGGDEFCAILQNDDLERCDELTTQFEAESNMINSTAANEWEKVNVSMGIARYNPHLDKSVEATVSRADQIMYENKRRRKAGRGVR